MKTDKILVLDPQLAGISGDMLLAALLDLGADPKPIRESIRSVSSHLMGCNSVDLKVMEVRRGEFRAKRAEVVITEKHASRTGSELVQALKAICDENEFGQFSQTLALNSLRTLVKAEAEVHGEEPGMVDLAEAGSADTIADIVGVASALETLDIGKEVEVYSLPVAVGGGLFKFSHGTVQAPAPAVISIVSGHHLPIIGGPVQAELATPTGMSILANLATMTGVSYPLFTPSRVGYGAGKSDFEGFPNVLRIVIGERESKTEGREQVAILETNLDDVTGETLGFLMELLREEGALDAHVVSAVGKKNRPTHILRVISRVEDAEKLEAIIFQESGTLGIRLFHAMREVASRKIESVSFSVDGRKVKARVKVSRDHKGKVVNIKPEYDDIARLARRFHVPLRRFYEAAVREAERNEVLRRMVK